MDNVFEDHIKGQPVVGWGWIQPTTENCYVGGYYTEYANGYRVIIRGGGASGMDYNSIKVISKDGIVTELDDNTN